MGPQQADKVSQANTGKNSGAKKVKTEFRTSNNKTNTEDKVSRYDHVGDEYEEVDIGYKN